MTTADPATQARALLARAAEDRAAAWGRIRRTRWPWLVLPVLVAGWDATRAVTLPLAVGLGTIPLVLATADAAARAARDGARAASDGAPPGAPASTSLWLISGAALLVGTLLLVVVGAPGSALVLALGTILALAWAIARDRLGDGPAITARTPAMDLAAALLVPVVLATTAAVAAALLPRDGAPSGDPALPWAWILAYAAWRAGRACTELAATTPGPSPLLGWGAVAGQALAVVVALTQGPVGGLVALGLAAGLLPAAMVVTGRARRGAREAEVLDRLLAVWLAILLLGTWGVLRVEPWPTAIVVTGAMAGYQLVAIALARLAARRRRPRDADAATLADPSLVIVLPLSRAVPELRPLVLALRSQTYADTRIVVAALPDVDVEVAAEWLGEDAVLAVGAPPAGWEPRAWARHVALMDERSTSDLALIVDERTILAPVAARVLVEHARATGVDAIGAIPRNALPSLEDRVAGSGPTLWRFGWEPRWWVALTRGRPARLVGPDAALLLIRVAAYRATVASGVGGAARDGLARRVADDGRRIGLVHAADLAVRRGETGIAGMLAWWRAMTIRLAGGTIADMVAMLVLVLVGWIGPVVLPLAAVLAGAGPGLLGASAIPIGLLVAARVLLAATQRSSILAIVWHPAMAVVAVTGIVLALADAAVGRRPTTEPLEGAGPVPPVDPLVPSRT